MPSPVRDIGQNYEKVRNLGIGSFGTAVLVRDRRSGELVAVKYIPLTDVDTRVERELLNHRKLSGHQKVVQFKEAFLTSTHLGIAMEFASGGDLFDLVSRYKRLTEDEARVCFQQLVCGAAWCHSQAVYHRDIKLENTLLEQEGSLRLKLCDFGYSKDSVRNSKPNTLCGTPAYVAPEVLNSKGGQYEGPPVDVWSIGVALYAMLVGSLPFQDPEHPNCSQRMIQRILQLNYWFPASMGLSSDCLDLLSRIFVGDPAQRIDLKGIQRHPWYLKNLPPECQNGGVLLRREPPAQTEEQLLAVVQAARAAAEEERRAVQHVAVELLAAAEVSADLEDDVSEW
ncbi:hypothetical protein COHA_002258 [Chlorella ohadii]|uniref:Protein kinase domain-containing protein n=1 Tax=Chlorella ohadii TaxID=2649997 RepID=A0AAD5DU86_9CHLO|nr:hypothetical protein COHA_002258 [Chlorella ohadii]